MESLTRRSLVALALGSAVALLAGCAGAPRPREAARVRFVVTPDTARVYTDERFVASARVLDARPAQFAVGSRRFTVTADGYFPHDLEVELVPGTTTVEIALRPLPP